MNVQLEEGLIHYKGGRKAGLTTNIPQSVVEPDERKRGVKQV
jgi:hypothetical protein